jgi:hypothetical protein
MVWLGPNCDKLKKKPRRQLETTVLDSVKMNGLTTRCVEHQRLGVDLMKNVHRWAHTLISGISMLRGKVFPLLKNVDQNVT